MLFKTSRVSDATLPPLMLDQTAIPGFFEGTKIATRDRWTPIEQLGVGDMVLTAEHGEQVITSVDVATLDASSNRPVGNQWPVQIPQGVLGNSGPMILAPDMRIIVEDSAAYTLFGQPCVSLQAKDLIGYCGIARALFDKPIKRYALSFTHAVSISAEGGTYFDIPGSNGARRFMPLDARQARLLVRHMVDANTPRRTQQAASGWI